LALRVVSPELVLVDPTLLGETRDHASGPGGDTTPEEHMSGETFHLNGSNGASPVPAPSQAAETADKPSAPALETVLFKAGLITADQLGEVVLERVQSGRPAGDIVVERGLVSRETLAQMLASPSEPAPAPAVDLATTPVAEHVQAPVAEPALASAAPPAVEPFEVPATEPVPGPAFEPAPAPAETVSAPTPVAEVFAPPASPPVVEAPAAEPAAQPLPAATDEAVQYLASPVEAPAPAEVPEPVADAAPPAPAVEAQPDLAPQEPEPAAPEHHEPAAAPDGHGFSMGEVHYGIRIRLAEGVTLDAGSYPSRERAVEAARGIASRLAAEGGEWPLVGDTLVRPEAVLAIEIESAVSWFASRQA
jgi:hypothetical protein